MQTNRILSALILIPRGLRMTTAYSECICVFLLKSCPRH